MIEYRCVLRVQEKPVLCSPLSVVEGTKLCLVFNLRYLNQFPHVLSFKHEDLRIAALMFEKIEYLFKFDLKSEYHVDIWPGHYKYLGLRWDWNGEVNYYAFRVLPFGLSTACYLFTKLMRPLIRYWRGRGLKAIVYLDDGIIAVKGEAEATAESMAVKRDLELAGLVVNVEKCAWEPSHRMEWLGFCIELTLGEFSVPAQQISALKAKLSETRKERTLPAKKLANLIGKIISLYPALPHY